jgi:hypothetical protein
MPAVNQPEVLIAAAGQKFDAQGELTDQVAKDLIAKLLTALCDLAKRNAVKV